MSFIEDLPYDNSLELYDKYRFQYKEFVCHIKRIISCLQTVTDIEELEEAMSYSSGIEGEPNLKDSPELIEKGIVDHYTEVFLGIEPGYFGRAFLRKYTTDQKRIEFTPEGDLISAFYVPEDLKWLDLLLWVGS